VHLHYFLMRLTRVLILATVVVVAYWLWLPQDSLPPRALEDPAPRVSQQPFRVDDSAAERAGRREESLTPEVVAPSSSMPSISLAGHLEQRVLESTRNRKPSSNATRSVTSAVNNRIWNPNGKVLSVAQEAELSRRLEQHNELMARLEMDEVALRREAFLQAVRMGQSDIVLNVQADAIVSQSEADVANSKSFAEQTQRLEGRLGKLMEDWAYTAMGTLEPDMIPRTVMVYVTKEQAPALFGVRRGMVDAGRSLQRDMMRFFSQLP
jgi:hypothetical protein